MTKNNSAVRAYDLDLQQAENLIASVGNKRSVLVQGHMGTGKSTLLYSLGKRAAFKDFALCYVDCTTKDLGDVMIPKLKEAEGEDFVRFATNEEFGLHLKGRNIILMLDEYGKANPAVKVALTRLILERKVGSYEMSKDSILFATTNLGSEGVGDILPAHARNRLTVVRLRKPNNMQWIEWGIANNIDPAILGWVRENPQLFQDFEEVSDPEKNPYIFHPKAQRAAFVSARSLHAASDIVKERHRMDSQTVTAALMGTIGDRGAMDLQAFIALADDLPSLDSIKKTPLTAKVPSSAAAICMVVYRSLSTIDGTWVDAWMDYMARLDKEAQGLFVNGVRSPMLNSTVQQAVLHNKKFTDFCMKHKYMFAPDQQA